MNKITSLLFHLPKRCLAFGAAALLIASFAAPSMVKAATASGGKNPATIATKTAASTKCGDNDLNCVIAVGDPLFTKREDAIKNLQSEVTTLEGKNRVTSGQANDVLNDLTTNLNNVTTLKSTFDNEKTAKAARQDIRNLYSMYRIYAVVLPRDSRKIHLDVESTLHDGLVAIEPATQNLIKEASSGNQTKLNSLYTDYTTRLTDSATQIKDGQNVLPDITVDNFNNNHATYVTNLATLNSSTRQASTDLKTAVSDLHQMRKLLGIK